VGSSVWGMEVLGLKLLVLALRGGASAKTRGYDENGVGEQVRVAGL
jgi:hypothetical protein